MRLKQLQIPSTIVEEKNLKAAAYWLVAQLIVEIFVEEERNDEDSGGRVEKRLVEEVVKRSRICQMHLSDAER